jgi:hypothetical protein
MRRIGAVAVAAAALAFSATATVAAKPVDKPAITLKLSTVLAGSSATFRYQVNVPASAIAVQDCIIRFPNGLVGVMFCDSTPNSGSGKKLTKYSIGSDTPQVGDYRVEIAMTLGDGRHLFVATDFTVIGPAVRFEVSGLVEQPSVCYIGIDCSGFPPADYPRQIATIKALDSAGHLATGYTGTVSFQTPISHITPSGLQNMTLTNGVGYVPVLVPSLSLGYFEEPFTSNCPSGSGNGLVLAVTDTVDPTIFGCQNIPGGSLTIVFPDGFFDDVSVDCPTGCFADPTNTIIVNTNLAPLFVPNLYVTQPDPVSIQGVTTANLYFTQEVDHGPIFVEGASIPITTLDACTLCSSAYNYLPTNTNLIIVTPNIAIENSQIQIQATAIALPMSTTTISMPATTIVTGAQPPVCFADSALLIEVACLGLP